MAWRDRRRGTGRRLGRRFGEPATLRRLHTVRDVATRTPLGLLRVKAPAAVGSAELVLHATGAGGEPVAVSGWLPAGLHVTVGAVVHTAAADAAFEADELVLPLSSPLAAAVDAGAVASLAEAVAYPVQARRGGREAAEDDETMVGAAGEVFVIDRDAAPAEPRVGDHLVAAGVRGRITGFLDSHPDQWRCVVGRAG
jgi:hypothetical protein